MFSLVFPLFLQSLRASLRLPRASSEEGAVSTGNAQAMLHIVS